jgi:hypothetical protein
MLKAFKMLIPACSFSYISPPNPPLLVLDHNHDYKHIQGLHSESGNRLLYCVVLVIYFLSVSLISLIHLVPLLIYCVFSIENGRQLLWCFFFSRQMEEVEVRANLHQVVDVGTVVPWASTFEFSNGFRSYFTLS